MFPYESDVWIATEGEPRLQKKKPLFRDSRCYGRDSNWHTLEYKFESSVLKPSFSELYSAFGKSLCIYNRSWIRFSKTIVSKIWIKQLHTLPVLHFSRCLTTEYSKITAHFNGNFDTDNQIYVP
jgi:hypothetical protein